MESNRNKLEATTEEKKKQTSKDYQNIIFESIKDITGQKNLITVPREFVNYAGSWDSAILLSQLLYWSSRAKRKDRGVYKSYKDWREEIALSEYEVKKSVKTLREKGVLETKLKKANGAPTLHYYLNTQALSTSINKFLRDRKSDSRNDDKMEKGNLTNLENHYEENTDSLTDITTETSSENTFRESGSSSDAPSSLFSTFKGEEKETEDIIEVEDSFESEAEVKNRFEIYVERMDRLRTQGISEKPISIPSDFEPDDIMLFWAGTRYPKKLIKNATDKFIDHFKSKGSKSCDWKSKWKKWIEDERSISDYLMTPEQRVKIEEEHTQLANWTLVFVDFLSYHREHQLVAKNDFYMVFAEITKEVIDEILDFLTLGYFKASDSSRYVPTLREINGYYYSVRLYEDSERYKARIDDEIAELREDVWGNVMAA